ncbi:MAG: T9SS type A sorting domain-containing protein [Flavobacteriales bacterium]|nr:T9SS type A sorting domain-containing protein [Flavobacteriales bacterium]
MKFDVSIHKTMHCYNVFFAKVLFMVSLQLLTLKNGLCQSVFPRFQLVENLGLNDTLCYSIINPTSYPMTFYPKVANLPGGEYITYSEDSLFSWLTAQVRSQGEDVKLDAIQALARLVKSPRHVNELGIYDHTLGIGRKKFSPIGWFSHYHAQCGDYMRYCDNLLIKAFGVLPDELMDCSIPYNHTMGQIYYSGSWAKVDFDPGSPSLMNRNPLSINGFASISDLVSNTELLVEEDRYLYADTVDLNPYFFMEDHRENYVGATEFYQVETEEDYEIEGSWTLCAGCSIELRVPLNPETVFLDLQTVEVQEMYQQFVSFQMTGDSLLLWQAVTALADYLDISDEEALGLIYSGNISFESPTIDVLIKHYYRRHVPTLTLRIPPSGNARNIGVDADLHLPFIVTDVTTSGTVVLTDTIIDSNGFNVNLWIDDTTGLEDGFVAKESEVNFLNDGWIYSVSDETVIKLAFNPGVYPIAGVDIEIDDLGLADNFVVESSICSGDEGLVTSLVDGPYLTDDTFSVFPNPTTGNFQVSFNNVEVSNYQVFDLMGRSVSSPSLSTGVYLIRMELENQVFTETLVVN